MKILLVDDDFFFQKALSFFLLDQDHSVLFARDGQKAIEKAEKNGDIDMVICDIDMPVLMGPEFILRLKELYPQKRPVIIIVSGLKNATTFLETRKIEYDHFFEKPLNLEVFVQSLGEIIRNA